MTEPYTSNALIRIDPSQYANGLYLTPQGTLIRVDFTDATRTAEDAHADVAGATPPAHSREYERGRAEGYRRCTRDVVVWLDQRDWPETLWLKIERGEHIGAATKGQS